MGFGAAGIPGDFGPRQDVAISGAAKVQDPGHHRQSHWPNRAPGGVAQGRELCSEPPPFLLAGGVATCGVS